MFLARFCGSRAQDRDFLRPLHHQVYSNKLLSQDPVCVFGTNINIPKFFFLEASIHLLAGLPGEDNSRYERQIFEDS